MSAVGFSGGRVLMAVSAVVLGLAYSTETEVSRHVKIFDVSYDVPDTPGVPRVLSPSFFRVSFHLHHSGHTLELTRNTGIRPQTVGCVHPTGRCQSTDVQKLVTFYQDVNNGASFQLTCSEELCRTFTLQGTFIWKNSMYSMEPIKDSRKYKIEKLSGSNQLKTDYIKLDETIRAPRRGRHKRASGQHDVELLFVTDYSVYQHWRFFAGSAASEADVENFINTFYAFLANGVDVRYLGINTEPYRIGVVYIGVVIAKSLTESPWSHSNGTVDADQVLKEFKDWVTNNRNRLPRHDHAMAFTRHNIVRSLGTSSSADIAGYAFQGGICEPESVSVVEESLNFISHTVAAHELGHSLGAKHDGNENSCRAYDHYIMEATSSAQSGGKARNPWRFSSCSMNEMSNLLESLDKNGTNCLKRKDYSGTLPNLAEYVTSNIGQQYNIHQQCAHIMRNSQSYACMNNFNNDFSTICTGLWCLNPSSGISCDLVIPFDYTTCGTGKWCVNGECMADNSAPREPGKYAPAP